jgi:UDP-2,3-diacylglucosamine pyrophosphatase LpxH
MTTISEGLGLGTLPRRYPQLAEKCWRSFAHRRLTAVLKSAKPVPFDDSSPIVFFSDLHRGDDSRADAFARNKELFLHALTHYYRNGFTYIEVGDGDELWKNRRFSDIVRAHRCVFDLLHKFNQENRLHLILGNHDISGSRQNQIEKDGIATHEGLILLHARTGQQIFVVHGHQADFTSDRLYITSRFLVRHVWKYVQLLGFVQTATRADRRQKWGKIEQRIIAWVQNHQQITICGHTHHPMSAGYGAPPYFNTGSCVYPGYITGIEFQDGEIMPVKWTAQPGTRQSEAPLVKRELIAPPKKLHLLG